MSGHEADQADQADQAVRDVLDALAEQVEVSPGAYHAVRAEWVRRQRRRKRLGVVVAIVLVVVCDVIGVWALERSDSGGTVIFEQQAPADPGYPTLPKFSQP